MTAIAERPPTTTVIVRQTGDPALRPPEMTVPEMLHETVHHYPDKVALLAKKQKDGPYEPTSYRELDEQVRHLALGLVDLGVEHGGRVALLSENRPEWAVTDLAALSIGAVNVPLYSTLPPPQVEYIVADAGAEVLIVSNQKQLAKALEIRARLPKLRHLVAMDPPADLPEGVTPFADLLARGAARPDGKAELERRVREVRPQDLASIIYTSGTTGAPKGAMLTHDNFMSNAQATASVVPIRHTDMFLSFLPLSHVFERMAGHYLPLHIGCTIAYAESVFTLMSNMVEVQPTIMASTPRIYEVIESRVKDGLSKQPDKKRKVAEWALKIGAEHNRAVIEGGRPGLVTRLKYLAADRLALSAMRDRITGGKLCYFISGGAPLPLQTNEFMHALGLFILEGYGLTETSPVICLNLPGAARLGTVGKAIPGVEVGIAQDGEILSRGPHIMRGYYNKPEETAQAINPEGWFHTGDIGELDDEGFLKITDRKKDIIVLANGKNVAPQPIEAKLKASRFVANAVLFGDRQAVVVALIVPDLDALKTWARENGLETKDMEALVKHPAVLKHYKAEIDRHTGDLADFEKVRRFALLTRDFSQERDELTPTLKVKRRVVAEHYAAEIQGLYRGAGDA